MTLMFPRTARLAPCAARVALVTAAILAGVTANPVAAQSVMEKVARDEIAVVADTDPDMAAAMRKARATLTDFLNLASAPRPGTDDFAVKVAIREGEHAEYFWIAPFKNSDGRFSGEINNTPRSVHSVKMGQTITFAQSDIVDWLYIDKGMMKGNYTACVLLKSAPPSEAEEFKKHFGLNCDF
jgi:uncharacterized protein YegJ (DUF2314 family)